MMAYGLRKLYTNFSIVAKNSIILCYNPYTSFEMNVTCTYRAQTSKYNHALSPIHVLEFEVFNLKCTYLGTDYPI